MEASCRDLGLMDYKTCWELQQGLFDALVARKAACKGATKQAAAIPAAYAGTAEADQASAREPAQRSAEAMPSKAGTQSGKGLESPTGSVSAAEGVEPSGATGEGSASAGTILLVEHPPVYTLGKSGHAENLLIGRKALEAMGAQFFHIDRGGDITFHGPGQLVCYPILDLECLGIGLRDYIGALEEAVIRTVAVYGITAGRMAGASGSGSAPESAGKQGAGQPPAAEITAAATATPAVTAATKASAAKAATAAKTATRQEPAIAAESAIAKSASVTAHSERCRARFAQ